MYVAPHYLLLSESAENIEPGRWRFVLRAVDGSRRLVVDEVEPEIRGERLELLTVVRGLESLDEPSCVTLVTRSTYVREGIRYGVSEWAKNGWRWESFGQMVPVKNADLWQRIERAMRFHKVDCRVWRFDRAHGDPPGPDMHDGGDATSDVTAAPVDAGIGDSLTGLRPGLAELVSCCSRVWRRRIIPVWETLVPSA